MYMSMRLHDVYIALEQAEHFPQDVAGAFERIYAALPEAEKREIYGISYMNDDKEIFYYAGLATRSLEEAESLECDVYCLAAGRYVSETIKDFAEKLEEFPKVFAKLYAHPEIDPETLAIEHYQGTDVTCMMRLKDDDEDEDEDE